jgi:hypothetical protein
LRAIVHPEEKKKKIRTLHTKVKGCGTRTLNPPQSLAHRRGDVSATLAQAGEGRNETR